MSSWCSRPTSSAAVTRSSWPARLAAELCRRPNRAEDGEHIAASIGIAFSVGGGTTAEALLHDADTAMYEAKSRGGARAVVYDTSFDEIVQQRSITQRMIALAIDEDRVVVHYQPILDLADLRIVGFEALARISDVDGVILPPASFINVAEECGLIVPIGSRVLDIACDEARRWQGHARAGRVAVAVNLSARQFEPGDLAAIVRRQLERTGLAPEHLHLELTETAIMDLRPDILGQLAEIRELGVQIGLDDFGTGYASLTHLRRLPPQLRQDRSVVRGGHRDRGVGRTNRLGCHRPRRETRLAFRRRGRRDRRSTRTSAGVRMRPGPGLLLHPADSPARRAGAHRAGPRIAPDHSWLRLVGVAAISIPVSAGGTCQRARIRASSATRCVSGRWG